MFTVSFHCLYVKNTTTHDKLHKEISIIPSKHSSHECFSHISKYKLACTKYIFKTSKTSRERFRSKAQTWHGGVTIQRHRIWVTTQHSRQQGFCQFQRRVICGEEIHTLIPAMVGLWCLSRPQQLQAGGKGMTMATHPKVFMFSTESVTG